MTKHLHRRPFPTFIACSMALLSVVATNTAPAATANGRDVEFVTVRFDDLDLDTEQGRNALTTRLRNAAREVCHANDAIALWRQATISACITDAAGRAMATVEKSQKRGLVEQKELECAHNRP
jgi:UrcA family protein